MHTAANHSQPGRPRYVSPKAAEQTAPEIPSTHRRRQATTTYVLAVRGGGGGRRLSPRIRGSGTGGEKARAQPPPARSPSAVPRRRRTRDVIVIHPSAHMRRPDVCREA